MIDEQGKVTFNEAEQAEVNRVVSERLSREGVQDSKEIVELLKDFDYTGTPAEVKAALKIQSDILKTQKAEQEKQVELDSLKEQSQATGTSPEILAEIKALKSELAEIKAERTAKKAEIENQAKAKTVWEQNIAEFSEEYPDVDLTELDNNSKFLKFAKGKTSSLKEIYTDYLEFVGETTAEVTARAVSKINRSTGSGKGNQVGGDAHLTTEQKTLVDEWNENSPKNQMSYKQYSEQLRK